MRAQRCRSCGKVRVLDAYWTWSHWRDYRTVSTDLSSAEITTCPCCDHNRLRHRANRVVLSAGRIAS